MVIYMGFRFRDIPDIFINVVTTLGKKMVPFYITIALLLLTYFPPELHVTARAVV